MTKEQEERKERLEKHVKVLIELRNKLFEREDWESLLPYSDAVTAGGMAIQRILREDFGDADND
jgi:hypothetical protein